MIFLLIILGYAILMIAFGAITSRKVKDASAFFVAGRSLSAGLVFSTLLAANIGAGSTVGATGLGYRDGLSAWWWVGSAGIGSLILAFTVGPKIWRIARENNLYTVGDYLEFRYDRSVRGAIAILLWLGSLAILAGQLIALEQIFSVTLGIGRTAGILLAAAVITAYFAAGGLHTAARVNAIQLIVKLVGFTLALVYLYATMGGWAEIKAAIDVTGVESRKYFDISGGSLAVPLGYIMLLVPSFIISPGILQKVFGAKDDKAVRRGIGLNALGLLAFAIVPVLLGMIAHAQYPELGRRELAMPELLTNSLPVWLGGLLLGALFSAELSAADAVLFMLTTSISQDFYKTFANPVANDHQLLKVARATAVACGMLGAALAVLFKTVIAALTIFYTMLSAALFLPLIAGLYFKRVKARAALATIIVSVAVTFSLEQLNLRSPSLIWGILSGAIVMALASLIEKKANQYRER
jgi:solute:Na+ symporter, SSS family